MTDASDNGVLTDDDIAANVSGVDVTEKAYRGRMPNIILTGYGHDKLEKGDSLMSLKDVGRAVQGFSDAVQHTDDDWEETPEGSNTGRIDQPLPHIRRCEHCHMPKPMALEKEWPCPVKVERKLEEYFGPALNHDNREDGEGGS